MTYEYQCLVDGRFELFGIPVCDYKQPQCCPKCGQLSERYPLCTVESIKVDHVTLNFDTNNRGWQPITLENVGPKPVRFERRSDLVKFCRQKKIYSGAL